MNKRLLTALAAYAVLAALAYLMVDEKRMRAAVLLLFGALAAKTLIWRAKSAAEIPDRNADPETDVPIRTEIPPK
jgi:hypothetical protein